MRVNSFANHTKPTIGTGTQTALAKNSTCNLCQPVIQSWNKSKNKQAQKTVKRLHTIE